MKHVISLKMSKRKLDMDAESPVSKRLSKYKCKVQPDWFSKFSWLRNSTQGQHYIRCACCKKDINIQYISVSFITFSMLKVYHLKTINRFDSLILK